MSKAPTEHKLDNLEIGRQEPGSYLIESFRVRRMKNRRWRILNPPPALPYRLTFGTLTEAKLWIVDELNGVHG
jgi:hypothetical protein